MKFPIEKVPRIFITIKDDYIQRVNRQGYSDNVCTDEFVEIRAALINTLRPFCSWAECGALFEKDHTSAMNAVKKHDVYIASSRLYAEMYFPLASNVVKEYVDAIKVSQMSPMELSNEMLRDTIKQLQNELNRRESAVNEQE
jgi:hypothetical protein